MHGNHAARRQFLAAVFQRIPDQVRRQVRALVEDGLGWASFRKWVGTRDFPRGKPQAVCAYYLRVCAVRDERAYP